MYHKILLMASLLINISPILQINAVDYPHLEWSGKHHIFIESGWESNSFASSYAFVIPVGDYLVLKSDDSKRYSSTLNVVENIEKANGNTTSRYHLDNGFVFFRTDDDGIYSSTENTKEINGNVVDILNREGNAKSVIFYEYADSLSLKMTSYDISCEGKVFSPKKTEHGYFFFRKLKPIDHTRHACYLIYYDYCADHDTAKNEFERLFSCIYSISKGCLQKLNLK